LIVMLFRPNQHSELYELRDRVRRGGVVTGDLMTRLITLFRPCLGDVTGSSALSRLNCLMEAQAWTDAAVALIEIAVPRWSLSRVFCEDGEWTCVLSRFPQMPEWLDDAVEGRHEVMALAILDAILAACEIDPPEATDERASVWWQPQESDQCSWVVCCDNFG
jgi:hypothetical protein